MIDTYNILSPDFERDAPRELMLLSIISQSFFQPFSLEDNLLVILTALTSGSGVGFNRAMLFLKQGDRINGEMWLGPRSAEEAGLIWEVLSTPGIGYVEILEHNRALVAKNQDTLSGRLRGLVYAADEESALIPAAAVCRKELLHVRDAAHEPQVDRRFLNLIGVDEFLCVPLLARDDVVGVIVLDNAITRTPIAPADIKLAGVCGLMAGNYIYSTNLHKKLLEMEKMAAMGEVALFVTHQLRNPIVAVGGFTDQLLKPDLPEDKRKRNLTIIRDEVRRLEDIIYQMGHFLKVSLKEPVYFDPGPVIDAVVNSPGHPDQGRGTRPERQDRSLPARDPLRPDLVRRGPPQPPRQRLRRDPAGRGRRHPRLPEEPEQLRPLGPRHRQGISNPDKDQLFRPFFTTKEKGMGLGLPFIKRVMDNAGGKIEVHSRVGKGTIFRLTFNFREREPNP